MSSGCWRTGGGDVNAREPVGGLTFLMMAVASDHLAVVKLLLDRGADANAADAGGMTALMRAVRGDQREICAALLDWKADPNVREPGGMAVLLVAAGNGRLEVVRLSGDPSLPEDGRLVVLVGGGR